MAGEPTAALRFTGVQRAASVGAPPAIPATVYSFVHWAILWIDGAGYWKNQLPFRPGRTQNRPRFYANHYGRIFAR